MSDETKTSGSKLVDLFQKDSQNHRVFWVSIGTDSQRKASARAAWDELDPFLLDEVMFRTDLEMLTKCILRERSRRQAPTTLPQASPEAETLLPSPTPVATSTIVASPPPPSNFFEMKAAEVSGIDVVVDNEPAQLTLPVLAEQERAAPNMWLRSALFRVVEKGKRTHHKGTVIAAWGSQRIAYWGETLDQADLDVMLQCAHLAASVTPGSRIGFTDRGMLSSLGRSYGAPNVKWLDDTMMRLRTAVIRGDDGHGAFDTENLLLKYNSPREDFEGSRARFFVVNPAVARFFIEDDHTALNWRARLELSTQLTRWLHGFLASHEVTANGVGLELLKRLAGVSSTRPLRKFKADVEKSIRDLLALDDMHLGLVEVAIVEGKEGPKLVWKRRRSRTQSLRELKPQD